MEEQKEREKTENRKNRFYFVKFRPSREEHEKEEAEKQYQLMKLARIRIDEEINQQRANAYQINKKLMWFLDLDHELTQKMREIKSIEYFDLGLVEPSFSIKSMPGRTGFLQFPGKDYLTPVRPDRKRCQKRLIKKGQINKEYLQKTRDEFMISKKSVGMTSCGTQELNDLIESLSQRIQHGNKKRVDEMQIYHEIISLNGTREMYNAPEPEPKPKIIHWYSRSKNSKRYTDWKRSAQHIINIRLDEIEKIKRDLMGRKARVTRLKADMELVRKSISSLQKELENMNSKRNEAYKRVCELSDQMKEVKSCYNEYQLLMTHAKELARKGDVVGLSQLCDTQVEGFMKQWRDSKAFKTDYEIRKLIS